jgi:hypothetical protein
MIAVPSFSSAPPVDEVLAQPRRNSSMYRLSSCMGGIQDAVCLRGSSSPRASAPLARACCPASSETVGRAIEQSAELRLALRLHPPPHRWRGRLLRNRADVEPDDADRGGRDGGHGHRDIGPARTGGKRGTVGMDRHPTAQRPRSCALDRLTAAPLARRRRTTPPSPHYADASTGLVLLSRGHRSCDSQPCGSRADTVPTRPQEPMAAENQKVINIFDFNVLSGAGGGNRTRDIQLGKLHVRQSYQGDGYKTTAFAPQMHQWLIGAWQNPNRALAGGGSASISIQPLTPSMTVMLEELTPGFNRRHAESH